MDILEKKLTEEEILANQVEGISHEWYGRPTELQSLFDRLCKFLISKYNSLIDLLFSNNGASNIKTTSGKTVEESLSVKADSDDVYTKTQTDDLITDRIIHTGNGDMLRFTYDFDGDGVVEVSDLSWNSYKLGGKKPEEYALASDVTHEYTYAYLDDEHLLEGSGAHFYFVAAGSYIQGEQFKLNGQTIVAVNNFNQPLGSSAFKTGDIVTGMVLAGKIVLNTRRVPYLLWKGASYSNVIQVANIALFDYISLSDKAVSLCRLKPQGSEEQMEVTYTYFIDDTVKNGLILIRHSAENEITIDRSEELMHINYHSHNIDNTVKVQEIWGY